MKAHLELCSWVYLGEPVTKGDVDRLAETFRIYLDSCGGLAEMSYTRHENTVCITAWSKAGKSEGMIAKLAYIRKTIKDALKAGGMSPGK